MPRGKNSEIVQPRLDQAALPGVFDSIEKYAAARRKFIEAQKAGGDWLAGNDNKVGAIAEFWVKLLYVKEGHEIKHVPKSNNKGWDFLAVKNNEQCRVSVKAITTENKRGKQVPLVKGKIDALIDWDFLHWDESVLIDLDKALAPISIAICHRIHARKAHLDGLFNAHRAVDRKWSIEWMQTARVQIYKAEKLKAIRKTIG